MSAYRLPAITAADTQGQLRQLKSYLYQLVEELNHSGGKGTGTVYQGIPVTGSGAAASSQTPGEVFAGIKSLIIKSADIVESYYEQMEGKFSGSYLAISDFGTFSEETKQRITQNSTAISRNFQNLQELTTDVKGMERTLIGVNAYINSGLLYYDGITPVYGIEVGQRTQVNGAEVFNKYARFTANKLSFYDQNNNEVAYISDQKLYITHVEVAYDFRMGHLVDTVQSDGSIVTKYLAGG